MLAELVIEEKGNYGSTEEAQDHINVKYHVHVHMADKTFIFIKYCTIKVNNEVINR